MNPDLDRFIACGMYAFTELQQASWRQLFDRFIELTDADPASISLSFDHDPALLRQAGLWFGHTCGYPLMTQLKDHVSPFCVPLFDVAGTAGKQYSSQIITTAGSDIEAIGDCRGRVCAMNNPDSNSGMNVLRYSLADLAAGRPFFKRVITTGGHLHSVEAVADGIADIAAIDCVSFQLIADAQPGLIDRVRVLGKTVETTGLPMVMARSSMRRTDTDAIIEALNRSLAASSGEVSQTLHLAGFAAVQLSDYDSILELEQYALERGYPELV